MTHQTLIFVPVYNQVREFPTVLSDIEKADLQNIDFLMVNNGSTDGSEDIVRQSGHAFLDIETNLGIGHSYLLALRWAAERSFRYFGSMAANAKMLPGELPRLLDPLHSNGADYVTGSRFMPGGASPNLPTFRRATIPIVNQVARLTTGKRLTDATNGFRVFKLGIIEAAQFDLEAAWLRTYGFEYFLYAKVLRDPVLRATEVPSTMRYPESGSYSKIRPGLDWWQMIKPWIRSMSGLGFDGDRLRSILDHS
jgi:dolichol-phosphate mannosyltransferase